ncbi:TIGR03987 family protein [Candidatus Gracilibacteria bacterium]|nr:TIGR03987 family protein [Candidatus Gracilibacteria bacterium]
MISVGIIFITLALVLYTTAVWTEKIKKKLQLWIVLTFASGFICDLIGTSIMFSVAEHKFSLALHSICGYLALIIMFLHLIWAILSIRKIGRYEEYFTKFSVFAWCIWLIAFISGIPQQ